MEKPVIKLLGVAPLLLVYDMQVSLDFYCNKLGFSLVSVAGEPPDFIWALVRLNDVELMMEPIYPKDRRPENPDPLRSAHHRDTVLYFGCPNIDESYSHLKAHGITLNEPRIAPYGMHQLYFNDPDGYLLCFQYPASDEAFGQWQKWYGKEFRKL